MYDCEGERKRWLTGLYGATIEQFPGEKDGVRK